MFVYFHFLKYTFDYLSLLRFHVFLSFGRQLKENPAGYSTPKSCLFLFVLKVSLVFHFFCIFLYVPLFLPRLSLFLRIFNDMALRFSMFSVSIVIPPD